MYFLSPQYYYTAGSDNTPYTTFNFRVMQVGLAFGVNYHDKNDFSCPFFSFSTKVGPYNLCTIQANCSHLISHRLSFHGGDHDVCGLCSRGCVFQDAPKSRH